MGGEVSVLLGGNEISVRLNLYLRRSSPSHPWQHFSLLLGIAIIRHR
jgi:hypothetical protein